MFDKIKFSSLLIRARGNRTNKDYSDDSGVSRAYISGFINKRIENAPNPDIIKRLADTAQDNVTYEDLMHASGYIENPQKKIMTIDYSPEKHVIDSPGENNTGIELTKRDLHGIERDLEKMIEEIKNNPNDGIAAYGGEIDDDDLELLENAFRTTLKVVKKINKEKYTPKKYKK